MSDDFNNPDEFDDLPDPSEFKKEESNFGNDFSEASGSSMMMGGLDVGTAFTFPKDDPSWINKLVIGGLMVLGSFLIIPIFILIGWGVGVAENVLDGEEYPMPEWHEWGKFMRDGFNIFIAQIVYTLPFWLLACIGALVGVGPAIITGSEEIGALGAASMIALSCLGVLFMVALLFIAPAIIIQYIKSGRQLGACFQFGEVIGIARDNISTIIVALVAIMVVQFAFSLVLSVLGIIPCLGWILGLALMFVAQPYFLASSNHLYGQIARDVVNYES